MSQPPREVDFRNIQQASDRLTGEFGGSDDLVLRRFRLGLDGKTKVLVAYLDGMAERRAIDEDVVRPLMTGRPPIRRRRKPADIVADHLLHVGQLTPITEFPDVVTHIVSGDAAVFVSGHHRAFVLDLKGFPHRAADKPSTELAVKGPFEGFTESVKTNVLLVRRRVQSADLQVKFLRIGRVSRNTLAVLHIAGIANPALVAEVNRRLRSVDHESALLTALIQSVIADNSWTLFPLYRDTERPDIVAQELLNGKVVLILDNTPFAVLLPSVLLDFFRTTEDYTASFWTRSYVRLLRFASVWIAVYLIPIYIAFLSFLPQLLPSELALAVLGSREGIPFPPVIEVVIMLIVVEILREATLRIPIALGSTLAIVGGLVLGTAAVEARIVSVLMLIIVSLTALAQFVAPGYEITITTRLITWAFLASSAVLGLIGLTLATVLLVSHLCSLNSVGVPYLAPFAPVSSSLWSDSFIRAPLYMISRRPEYLHPSRLRKTGVSRERHRRPIGDRELDQALESPEPEGEEEG